jgi:hypothetical protein
MEPSSELRHMKRTRNEIESSIKWDGVSGTIE